MPAYIPAAAKQVGEISLSLPDLTITDLWNQDTLLCYQVLNQGAATSPAGHITQLDLDGTYFATNGIDSALKPSKQVERCFNAVWACTPSQDTLQVCADRKDLVQEGDENNNCRQETWNCDATPP